MNQIFDTHTHYDDKRFDKERDALLENLPQKNVFAVINVGVDYATSKLSIDYSKKYDYIYAAVGIHPLDIEKDKDNLNKIEELLTHQKVVAVGEIGLDYYHCPNTKELQKEILGKQIKLANLHNLPVIIHDRNAHDDILKILVHFMPKGVVHCFSGDVNMAKKVLDLGLNLGIGGIVTRPEAKVLHDVVKYAPIDRLLLETDCPYLVPDPHDRKSRNDSSFIPLIAQKIADIKDIKAGEIMKITKHNAIRLFHK